jgi:Flp pilus assembly protein TadD
MLVVLLAAVALLWPRNALCGPTPEEQDEVCDPLADYFLGMEDYTEAIQRHREVIRAHPDNALAHYHLGFAYGLTGDHRKELIEYDKAVDLGLNNWELFLNLGLLYFEEGRLDAATQVLKLSALLAPWQPETHFNLAITYERRGMLDQAQQEMLLALDLDPEQADARNTLGVIYAERGDYSRARTEWAELHEQLPDYEPARDNLAILERIERGEQKGPGPMPGFAHAR